MDGDETAKDSRTEEDSRTERGDDPGQGETTTRERIVDEITDVMKNLYGTDNGTDDEKPDDDE